jgi:hypothetical protein
MKVIPLGLEIIPKAGFNSTNPSRDTFEWVFTPSNIMYDVYSRLLGIGGATDAAAYMVSKETIRYTDFLDKYNGYTNNEISAFVINAATSADISALTTKYGAILAAINSGEDIMFVYADAASPAMHSVLRSSYYNKDVIGDLERIYDLLQSKNVKCKITYLDCNKMTADTTTSSKIDCVILNYKKNYDTAVNTVIDYIKNGTA